MIGRTGKNTRTVGIWAVACIGFSIALMFPAYGGVSKGRDGATGSGSKISPALRAEVAFLAQNPEYDYAVPVIVQVDPEFFRRHQAYRRARGADFDNSLALVHGYRSRLTAPQIRELMESKLVEYVTVDAPVRSFGDTSSTTDPNAVQMDIVRQIIGSDQVEATGECVGLALFDSGINEHQDMKKYERTVVSVDFTSGQEVHHPVAQDTDDFGHGTHLAGLIGGAGGSNGHGKGVAEKVEFIDVKVIGVDGYGMTSDLIQAIDWVIANKNNYNIRVANLSLGHPPVESYTDDPLCLAVRNMVAAGITTVVSAGNLGKTEVEDRIWSSITSPGIEPSVITVAPLNMRGSLTHSDDIATSYGSRGPTIDGLFKPDISAPGNRLAGFAAPGTTLYNDHPELIVEEHYLVHPVNGEVPPVKGRPWKLPHYANRGKTSSSGGELASARSCFSTVRTALGKLRITGLLARFDVARSFPQFPRPLLLQPTIWTSERGADLGSGRCQPRPHLPIYRMTPLFLPQWLQHRHGSGQRHRRHDDPGESRPEPASSQVDPGAHGHQDDRALTVGAGQRHAQHLDFGADRRSPGCARAPAPVGGPADVGPQQRRGLVRGGVRLR